MYIPHYNVMAEPDVHAFVAAMASAEIVTAGPDGIPVATLLPILWSDDGTTVTAHMARANPHWRLIEPGQPCLAIVAGPQAYISPSWYAAKAEHGRVVPTWNYSAVHLTGTATVHDDAEWLRDAVTRLTDRHERPRAEPWAVTDAPETYIDKNLKAIVGIEIAVTTVEAKAKLSQNRSEADQSGVVAGLAADGADPAAGPQDTTRR